MCSQIKVPHHWALQLWWSKDISRLQCCSVQIHERRQVPCSLVQTSEMRSKTELRSAMLWLPDHVKLFNGHEASLPVTECQVNWGMSHCSRSRYECDGHLYHHLMQEYYVAMDTKPMPTKWYQMNFRWLICGSQWFLDLQVHDYFKWFHKPEKKTCSLKLSFSPLQLLDGQTSCALAGCFCHCPLTQRAIQTPSCHCLHWPGIVHQGTTSGHRPPVCDHQVCRFDGLPALHHDDGFVQIWSHCETMEDQPIGECQEQTTTKYLLKSHAWARGTTVPGENVFIPAQAANSSCVASHAA